MSTNADGFFITIEGVDGSGKTTFAARVKHILVQLYALDVILTCEPTKDTDIGKFVRSKLSDSGMSQKTKALLFTADRAHHVATVIAPALKSGAVVICDRYTESTIAYQHLGDSMSVFDDVTAWATNNLKPDLTFFLDFFDSENPVIEDHIGAGINKDAKKDKDNIKDVKKDSGLDIAFHRILSRAGPDERHTTKDETIKELLAVQSEYRTMFTPASLSDLSNSKLRPQKCVIIDATLAPEDQDLIVELHLREHLGRRRLHANRGGESLRKSVD